ncbi:MAG: hypothetical protein AB1491_10375 [Thermodesulfobacteriota bacterium]
MENNNHYRYRLNLDEAKEELYKEISGIDRDGFKYIYLFGFNHEDKLIWGDVLGPDDPESKLHLIINLAELLVSESENIYFILKVKLFNDYFEGVADMLGTMESVKGFIKAWNGFEDKKAIPALKRYMVEFVNHSLGLPFRYSENQRQLDMKELLPKKK